MSRKLLLVDGRNLLFRMFFCSVKDNFYLIGDLATGIGPDTPPLAPCVFIVAAKQANVVLSYALDTLK